MGKKKNQATYILHLVILEGLLPCHAHDDLIASLLPSGPTTTPDRMQRSMETHLANSARVVLLLTVMNRTLVAG